MFDCKRFRDIIFHRSPDDAYFNTVLLTWLRQFTGLMGGDNVREGREQLIRGAETTATEDGINR